MKSPIGKLCASCGKEIKEGNAVWNCWKEEDWTEQTTAEHEECWDKRNEELIGEVT